MKKECSVIALIPARGGSKGVHKKNIRLVGGKPLIAWTIEAAKKSKYIDRIVVSTDDREIATVSRDYHVEILERPKELAKDDTPGIDVVIHALTNIQGYTHVVLLQPTSPLRTVEDIDHCIEICLHDRAEACVSVCEAGTPPYWMYTIDEHKRLTPFVPNVKTYTQRQIVPKVYSLNGAVYVANVNWLLKTKTFLTEQTLSYIMPQERSIDIDTPFDLEIADYLLRKVNDTRSV